MRLLKTFLIVLALLMPAMPAWRGQAGISWSPLLAEFLHGPGPVFPQAVEDLAIDIVPPVLGV
jgi:hypothetical protein